MTFEIVCKSERGMQLKIIPNDQATPCRPGEWLYVVMAKPLGPNWALDTIQYEDGQWAVISKTAAEFCLQVAIANH